MDEAKREARRRLLAEIESSWDSPKPGAVKGAPAQAPTPEELDAAADRLIESLSPPPLSSPDLQALDSGWGEEDQEDDEDEDEDEESEPALPDERLDPVAYAAAEKARDQRIEARRERKRVKGEAKKARRRARSDAAKVKQKAKTKKTRPPAVAQAAKVAKAKAHAEAAAKSRRARAADGADGSEAFDDESAEADVDDAALAAAGVPSRARAKAPPSRPMAKKPMLSGTNTWMLAIALLVFVAAAIFAAVVAR